MKKRVKKTFSIHHWCGLIAGMFILVISLSGVILVFDDDIDEAAFASHAQLQTPAKALHVDKSINWVRAENPGWDIRVPSLPASPDEALHYELRQGQLRRWLFVHPETGEKLSTVGQAHNRFSYVVLNIHYNLLSGTPGKIVVLLVGLALLLLTITGFILYRRSLVKVLTFRQKISFKSRRSMFSSLHRIIGVWALAFNLLMCVTGLSLAITVVNAALKGGPKEVAVPEITTSVDAAMAAAKAAYPDFEITYLRFPVNAEGKIQLMGRLASDPSYYGRLYSKIQADYSTGALSDPYFVRDQPWLDRFLTSLHPIHFGDYAGLFVKLLYAFFGLMPGILSVSGFVIWYYRQQPQQEPKPVQRKMAKVVR
ncbi:PepSY-associated TM helix domain-containing protein [Pontibacter anaerobius]|uniref:PepSY-associated TM helix domain-containing protein n=1 Tax=Pontibacter anaerobius TaxID=2993940 RepID=A0ABT3RBB8_9BACT|nr:PepSY-associated TM helix domain-containing protein [Pontibacter anaerobius]MCX2738810.1 PepSY-associated TM helix domain-containing protein [Pontibacter anaerobius]